MQTPTSSPSHPLGLSPGSPARTRPRAKDEVPQWLPITLLAVTTAALVGPVYLLRKQRASALQKSMALPARKAALDARFTPLGITPKTATVSSASLTKSTGQWPPPRRRTTTGTLGTSFAGVRPGAAVSIPGSAVLKEIPKQDEDSDETLGGGGAFTGLYAAGAFGGATLIVFVVATLTVWGVKTNLGVETTEEYSRHMRHYVATKLSWLSQRIHRPPTPEPLSATSADAVVAASQDTIAEDGKEWNWDDATARLSHAMDTGGAYAWAETVVQEVEAEAEQGRREREELIRAGIKSRS
ncbi:hypothetical protein HWV62_40250 [Athelia sp. TMB]|nr:hypothetical protein HWV62_40250 [Athelia sp. TMB]